jgi:hypothetical protein
MPAPVDARLPMVELVDGSTIVFEPIDPTTGNTVLGVTVSEVSVYGENTAGPDLTAFTAQDPEWLNLPVTG